MYKTTLFNTHSDSTLPTLEEYLDSVHFSETLTEEMATFSYNRTQEHRDRVLKNIQVLLQQNLKECLSLEDLTDTAFEKFKTELIQRGENHDRSKFFPPENEAYVHINWKHHLEKDKDLKEKYAYPNEMNQEKIDKAIQHHWQINSHHANYYFIKKEDGTLETNKMEIQKKLEHMTDADLIEMVADWMAVSQEYKTCCRKFAESNIGNDKRWPFSEKQKTKIFTLIDTLERALQAINDPSSQPEENTSIKLGR
jgi:Family of unknown function (DUF5662)